MATYHIYLGVPPEDLDIKQLSEHAPQSNHYNSCKTTLFTKHKMDKTKLNTKASSKEAAMRPVLKTIR